MKVERRALFVVLGAFVFSRVGLFFTGALSSYFLPEHLPKRVAREVAEGGFLERLGGIWTHFDAHAYLEIAEKGYHERGLLNFFPLYPMLAGIAGSATGSVLWGGIIVSNVALLISALVLLGRSGWKASLILLLNPVGFLLSAPLSESLFLCLTLLAFRFYERREWVRCGVMGFLSALTRYLGVLVAVALAVDYALGLRKGEKWSKRSLFLLIIFLAPVSFGLYCWNWTGSFFYFAQEQGIRRRELGVPLRAFLTVPKEYRMSRVQTVVETGTAVLSLALLVSCARRKKADFVYALYSVLVPLSTETVRNMPRFASVIFPFYEVVSEWKWYRVFLCVSSFLMFAFGILWFNGVGIIF